MSGASPRNGWQARHSIAEAVANVRGSGLISVTVIVVVAAMVAAAVVVDLGAAHRILTAEKSYLDSGGDLIIARPADKGSIDAAACSNLSGAMGVRTAFALDVHTGAARIVGRPETQQTVVAATSGVAALLGIEPLDADQAVVSTLIADRWQWSTGSQFQFEPDAASDLDLPQGVLTTAAVADLGLISEGASTGVLLTRAAAGAAQSCYVQVTPAYKDDLMAAIPALLGETSSEAIQVAERLPAGGFARDPAREFDGRSTRWIGAAAGAIAGLLWAIVGWTRRGRAALYASIGVPWSGGVLIRWTEGLVVVGAGILWGAALGLGGAVTWLGVDPRLGVTMAVQHVCAALTAGFVVTLLTGVAKPPTLAMLKDR